MNYFRARQAEVFFRDYASLTEDFWTNGAADTRAELNRRYPEAAALAGEFRDVQTGYYYPPASVMRGVTGDLPQITGRKASKNWPLRLFGQPLCPIHDDRIVIIR